jgi:hypothetical protein
LAAAFEYWKRVPGGALNLTLCRSTVVERQAGTVIEQMVQADRLPFKRQVVVAGAQYRRTSSSSFSLCSSAAWASKAPAKVLVNEAMG